MRQPDTPPTRGRHNSSITRVRPFFTALLQRDPSGLTWMPQLLASAPRADAVLTRELLDTPGQLSAWVSDPRTYVDRVLGREVDLLRCFEFSAPPSASFLQWLIQNPDRLRWPEASRGVRRVFGGETQRRRQALIAGNGEERAEAQQAALLELDRLGVRRSRRRWWAFEGFTEVDCCLETDRLLLFIEGKRTEVVSSSTDWFPERNQLVRNLEVVGELADGRTAFVLLITEETAPELTLSDVERSAPHLTPSKQRTLFRRYLGQATWRDLAAAVDVDFRSLPDTSADVS